MTDLIAIQKIAGWEKLKTLVLDSVSSPITKRVYNMALDEFLTWFQQAPRPGFTKATVSAWRVSAFQHYGRHHIQRSPGSARSNRRQPELARRPIESANREFSYSKKLVA